jgi:CubicO group peptidase (beta-lactamase class C family)
VYHRKSVHISRLPLLLLLLSLVYPMPVGCAPKLGSPRPLDTIPLVQGSDPVVETQFASLPGVYTGTIGLLLAHGIERNLVTGGVVVVGNYNGILSITARGRLDSEQGAPLLDERTIFDLASLTKVVATAPAVMKLLDQGKIKLNDPLSRWFPEFRHSGQREITILQLLTHTSGLDDARLRPSHSIHAIARRIAAKRSHLSPGSSFNYADSNYILLAELVHRVSGKPFDVFCKEQIYGPLGMRETMFSPPKSLADALAPTAGCSKGVAFYKGVVQDANARRLGGVAGHAGLFSSALDLSRYARLMLGHGALNGKRILSKQVVSEMTAAHFCGNPPVKRGLGWDMDSPYSSPKGTLFSERSFGHTGYSGSSIWIDPQTDLFVILLTNRRNYHDVSSFNKLRRDISIVAAAQFGKLGTVSGLSAPGALLLVAEDLESVGSQKSAPNVHKRNPVGRHHLKQVRRHHKVVAASSSARHRRPIRRNL